MDYTDILTQSHKFNVCNKKKQQTNRIYVTNGNVKKVHKWLAIKYLVNHLAIWGIIKNLVK